MKKGTVKGKIREKKVVQHCSLTVAKCQMKKYFAQSQSEYHQIRSQHFQLLPKNPEEAYGSEWKGWQDLFADSCMRPGELLALMKENKLYDFEMLKTYQLRVNNPRIPRNPRYLYTTKEVEWLRLELIELRKNSNVVAVSHAFSHRVSVNETVRKRLRGGNIFPYHLAR